MSAGPHRAPHINGTPKASEASEVADRHAAQKIFAAYATNPKRALWTLSLRQTTGSA